jgi:hypothetical protein
MNCQEFENSFEALARGALTDAAAAAEALAHEKACADCAARRTDERALSTGLRALASGMQAAAAPARVESELLAAFRARAASAGVGATSMRGAVNVVPFAGRAGAASVEAPRVEARRWSWAKTAAVASLAAAASLALFFLVQTRNNVNAPRVAARGNQSKMIEPPPPVESGVQPTPEVASASASNSETTTLTAADNERASRASFTPRVRAVDASYGNGGARGGRAGAVRAGDVAAQELTTEFIPLVQGAQYQQAEEAHLVRVELPRTALASFGLPVNAEAPAGRVKADVLLGEDGVARAIRFVR